MTDLFHMVFAGPERETAAFVDELAAAGYPAQRDVLCAGFEPELLVEFVEAIGDGELGEATYTKGAVTFAKGSPLDIADRHQFELRMHGWVHAPAMPANPLQERLLVVEGLVAGLIGGDR